jgi:hypothetical protein
MLPAYRETSLALKGPHLKVIKKQETQKIITLTSIAAQTHFAPLENSSCLFLPGTNLLSLFLSSLKAWDWIIMLYSAACWPRTAMLKHWLKISNLFEAVPKHLFGEEASLLFCKISRVLFIKSFYVWLPLAGWRDAIYIVMCVYIPLWRVNFLCARLFRSKSHSHDNMRHSPLNSRRKSLTLAPCWE